MRFDSKSLHTERRVKDYDGWEGAPRYWVYIRPLSHHALAFIKCECGRTCVGSKNHHGAPLGEWPISFEEQFYAAMMVSMCEEENYPAGKQTKNGSLKGYKVPAALFKDIGESMERMKGKFTPEELAAEWLRLATKHDLLKRGGPKFKPCKCP